MCRRKGKDIKSNREGKFIQSEHLIHPEYSDEKNHAILNKFGHHYIYPGNDLDAENWHTVPLCQFIPERDQKNYQYGEGVFENLEKYVEYAGWGERDKISPIPPRKYYTNDHIY